VGEAAVLRDARQAACSCILLTGDFPDPGRRTAQDGWPLPSPGADSKTFCIPFKTLKWHLLWFINEAIGCASLQEDQCNFPFVGVCEQDYRPVTCAFVRMGVGRRTVSFYR